MAFAIRPSGRFCDRTCKYNLAKPIGALYNRKSCLEKIPGDGEDDEPMVYESHSPAETREIAKGIAERISGPAVVCLTGDLGAGKTEFAKGFAEGLGISEAITSPTFTIINEYTDGRRKLAHFDVYRISLAEEMYEAGYEDYFYGDWVCLVEWAELIAELIPPSAIKITIEKDYTMDNSIQASMENEFRRIHVEADA